MSVGRVGCLKLSDPQEQIATLAEVWRHSGLNNKAVFLSSFGRKVPFVFSFFWLYGMLLHFNSCRLSTKRISMRKRLNFAEILGHGARSVGA